MKLRHILVILFCIVAIAPVGVFWFWPYSQALDSEINDVRERHLVIANGLSRALERYFVDLKTTVDVIVAQVNDPNLETKIMPVFENLSLMHICIADLKTGKVLRSIQPDGRECPATVPPERFEHFKNLSMFNETVFSGVLPTPHHNNAIFGLHRKSDVLIIAAITTDYVVQLGRSINFGERGHSAIVDQNGRAMSHPSDDWQASRFDMSKLDVVKKMLSRQSGVEKFYSPALKVDMVAGYTFVPTPG